MAYDTLPEDSLTQSVMRRLALVWIDFEGRLEQVPIIRRLNAGRFTLEDYRALLLDLRQQVVDGGCWIARAASHVDAKHIDLRSRFMRHAVTEHRDFQMLEANYVNVGGAAEDIRRGRKNIGSEALSAYMFHKASQPNPFDLLGAMFIIEGLGSRKATEWGTAIRDTLHLRDDQVSFLLYHGEEDDDHLADFEKWVTRIVRTSEEGDALVRTAEVVARLYALQLEEVGRG
ncbi:iron-containing redox enzyme family protein [Parvularcula marina]|uniref:3-oxoacyl-ACP synthase n=1 Tax=Parvularcula marina TaxID=2292771 RepID=A0A371R7N7_9PROT|nr:iron-containing redox enzyme family protein [Parvularcula marina]RFB01455.1 3-oxoacyl-ACP synthase [Parvularcula marina]